MASGHWALGMRSHGQNIGAMRRVTLEGTEMAASRLLLPDNDRSNPENLDLKSKPGNWYMM